ncbi:MAG: hypothetical protein ACHQHO_05325 [Solirubrobacterales bacterium]
MSAPVEPSLFDFVDEFAAEVQKGELSPLETLAANARIITFCESFFVQFFANVLGKEIEGFDPQAKRSAAGIAIELKDDQAQAPVRALIGLFEKFCDMYADIIGGAYGAAEITYASFHRLYVGRLLRRAAEWAAAADLDELETRIVQSQQRYEDAVKSRKW